MRTTRSAWWSALLLAATPVIAQVTIPPTADPGAVQQRQIEEERRRREMERERPPLAEPLKRPALAAPETQVERDAVRFFVREIRFSDSEILSREELASLARDYEGREVSLADLRQLTARINDLYRSKGVVTAQAVIPQQDVTGGVIRIRLVEGRLGKINLRDNDSTNEMYIVERLRIQPGELMDIGRLEEALVRFNRTNDVQLQAELKPGEAFATTDLGVIAKEPIHQELRLSLDTLGATATGRNRTGLAYENRSLFGYRDDFSVSYTKALGQESSSATYAFPINTWGGRLSLGYYKDKTAIKRGPLATLDITGESEAQTLSLRQPTFVDSTHQVDAVIGTNKRRYTNWIDGTFLTRTDTDDMSLGVEAQWYDARSNWVGSFVRAYGDARVGDDHRNFIIDRGTIRHNRDLGGGFSFRGSLFWQSTHQTVLPSSEQLFIGGDSSVRGYPVGIYAGDTGQLVNLELHHPLFAASNATHGVAASGFFFVDYGRVKPYRAPNSTLPRHDDLTGVGWGAHVSVGKNVYFRLVFGYGLNHLPDRSRNYEVNLQLVGTAF